MSSLFEALTQLILIKRCPDAAAACCRGWKALEVAKSVLLKAELSGLELYSFQAHVKGARIDIRLDKVDQSPNPAAAWCSCWLGS